MRPFFLMLFLFLSCSGSEKDVPESLKESPIFQKPAGENTPTIFPLEGLKTVPYEGDSSFFIVDRLSQIERYPCGSCHQPGEGIPVLPEGQDKPHEGVHLKHGLGKGLSCATCHVSSDVSRLHGIEGEVSIQQAPLLCATCHSTPYKDWLKGAHGKRIGQWIPPRVVYSCAQCHNPHSPAWEKRMPAPGPKLGK